MREHIQHEEYKGHEIRSTPFEVLTKERRERKVQFTITFPPKYRATITGEYFDHTQLYSILGEAHTAGLDLGRGKIDKSIQKQSPLTALK